MVDIEQLREALGKRAVELDDVIRAAARERLALLPEKCEHGEEERHGWFRPGSVPAGQLPGPVEWCPGKVYPPALVERIGESMRSTLAQIVDISLEPSQFVVLDALNAETP